nr:hypothetical protein [uncultured Lichenicoccus sp.]
MAFLGLGWGDAARAQSLNAPTFQPQPLTPHPPRPKAHGARQPKAPVAAATPAPPAENLVVHGARRYETAPMPNQAIHDPADVMRDPATGAPIGRFGHAYMDANPVPPVNPALQGDQSPVAVGVQR